jgi:L-asparagine oxygenase
MFHDLRALIRGVQDRGFEFREQLLLGVATEKLARAIGEPAGLGPHSPVHTVTPKSEDEAGPNTYSGNYGLAMFPFHTDMANWHVPARYLMLRSLVGAEDVATVVVDARPIIDSIGIQNLTHALGRGDDLTILARLG